jgi:hypothetical protein
MHGAVLFVQNQNHDFQKYNFILRKKIDFFTNHVLEHLAVGWNI